MKKFWVAIFESCVTNTEFPFCCCFKTWPTRFYIIPTSQKKGVAQEKYVYCTICIYTCYIHNKSCSISVLVIRHIVNISNTVKIISYYFIGGVHKLHLQDEVGRWFQQMLTGGRYQVGGLSYVNVDFFSICTYVFLI